MNFTLIFVSRDTVFFQLEKEKTFYPSVYTLWKHPLVSSAYDPDPLDPQDFGFLDPDSQKYADPRIRIHGVKYQPKTTKKKFFTPKPQLRTFQKKILDPKHC